MHTQTYNLPISMRIKIDINTQLRLTISTNMHKVDVYPDTTPKLAQPN